jgi:ribosomal protein S18 acetylase RimI-like enzyme
MSRSVYSIPRLRECITRQKMLFQPIHQPWLSRLKIRPVLQTDLPALEWEGEFTHFRCLYQEVYRASLEGKSILWVADLPGKGIIGQVFVQLSSNRTELADGVLRAYLYAFRVRPAYRNQGVGRRLLMVAETDLVKRGFRWVSLNVGRDNPEARRFYERYGYRVVAAEPGNWSYLDDQGRRQEVHEPAWRMQKMIASASSGLPVT